MTYSVTALDASTGQLGVAVHSCYPGVGAVVPHVRAGVGAVATQAAGDPALAAGILDRLASGASPEEALAAALAADFAPDSRQLAVVTADGRTAAHTGTAATGYAGHHLGDGFVVAANLAASPRLLGAMAGAYRGGAELPFADRLLGCLAAAESTGGDLRGPLSAGLLVAGGIPDLLDVRIDASAAPLADLATAAGDIRAYALPAATVAQIGAVAATPQPLFWRLLALAQSPDADLAELAEQLRAVLTVAPALGPVLDRFTTGSATALRAGLGRPAGDAHHSPPG